MSDQQQMRSVMIVLVVVSLLLSGSIALLLLSGGDEVQESKGSSRQVGDNFVLNSNHGSVSLQQFRGKAVLLFFGYTHCPDVCPTTMSNVADAMALLTKEEQVFVQPLFVTVDPLRDTVEHLAKYVSFFHPKLIGLSGSEAEVRKAAEAFSVQYFLDDQADAGRDSYYMNHTSYLFLIDPKGKLVDLMSEHTSPADIADALRQYVSR